MMVSFKQIRTLPRQWSIHNGSARLHKTNGATPKGISLKHCAVVFDPMPHVGTSAQQQAYATDSMEGADLRQPIGPR